MNQQLDDGDETAVVSEIRTIHPPRRSILRNSGGTPLTSRARSARNASHWSRAAGLIPQNLADGKKSGYLFELAPTETAIR